MTSESSQGSSFILLPYLLPRCAESLLRKRDAIGDRGELAPLAQHRLQAGFQAGLVRDLDGQSRTRIQFQDQRPLVAVENDVDSLIAQARQLVAARAELEQR